jgi:predicted ribosomally synthesized peptide with nif11-like leader
MEEIAAMKEELKLFLQKLTEDKDLQEKMQACKTPEEAYAVASLVQEGFTFEEFTETMTKLHTAMSDSEELSDEDLAQAAGGALTTSEKKAYGDSVIYISGGVLATALIGYVAASSVM